MTGAVFSLYILRCSDDSLYTGITTDVGDRIAEHENGARGAKYLRGRGPLKLEFTEEVGDRARAQRLEYRVKRLSRAAKEALIRGDRPLSELIQDSDSASASGCA